MKDYFSSLSVDDTWLMKESGWVKDLQSVRESQLALGNGFLGSRAVLEEIPYDAAPGTFIAGIFDHLTAQVAELVNFPNPFNFKLAVNGEKIGVAAMDVVEHKRALNMEKAVLLRRTRFKDSKGRRYDYQSMRFVSMCDKNIGVMRIIFTPLDDKIEELDIQTGIDTAVFNKGVLTEGRKKHFRLREAGQYRNAGYLIVDTYEKKHTVIYRSGFYYKVGARKQVAAEDNIFQLKSVKKGQSVVFTKIFYIGNFSPTENLEKIKRLSERKFRRAFNAKLEHLLKDHVEVWRKLWDEADIKIEGTYGLQRNMRFNIYHMIICGAEDDGFSGIGARTLSGEGYRGHVFWDVDIFMFPFYLYTFPHFAKNMLLYRYKRLDKAREIARKNGYKGAMFPWESADTGVDESPTWAKNLDGTIIKILTDKFEHHITADIAYACYKYYLVTDDDRFMDDFGYEILFEAARFWASRVKYNKKKNIYEIKHVIGPDEFHEDVNNNAYTNLIAKWNLSTAHRMFLKLRHIHPDVYSRLHVSIGVTDKEANEWRRIASRIRVKIRKDRVIEQFDGFFKKKRVVLREFSENGIPLLPPKFKLKEVGKTQLVKQADVLMALYLLSDQFRERIKRNNYKFYVERTVHKSSLSPSVHSLMALECGDMHRSYQFFDVSLHADISNLHGNTSEGIHAASCGGTWQALINGYAGVRIRKGVLSINPKVPTRWKRIVFTINYRSRTIKIEVENKKVKLRIVSGRKGKLEVGVFGVRHFIHPKKGYAFTERLGKVKKQEYY